MPTHRLDRGDDDCHEGRAMDSANNGVVNQSVAYP